MTNGEKRFKKMLFDVRNGVVHYADWEIDPELAAAIMGGNNRNRPQSPANSCRLGEEIKQHKWMNNYDPIIIAADGTLMNGQHRLGQCEELGISIICDIRLAANFDAFHLIDGGRNRSVSDAMCVAGWRDKANIVASVIPWLWALEDGVLPSRNRFLARDIGLEIAERHPDIALYVDYGRGVAKSIGAHKSVVIFMWYVCSLIDKEKAKIMFDLIKSGAEIPAGSPIISLRGAFLKSKGVYKLQREEQLALFIKCWNACYRHLDVKFVRWSKNAGERFPQIAGIELSGIEIRSGKNVT